MTVLDHHVLSPRQRSKSHWPDESELGRMVPDSRDHGAASDLASDGGRVIELWRSGQPVDMGPTLACPGLNVPFR